MKILNKDMIYFEEPKLEFQYGQCTEDCRTGLTLFGPYKQNSGIIKAGVIGTRFGIDAYSTFVYGINQPVYTTSLGRPFFPGFKSVFGMDWPSTPLAAIEINNNIIEELTYIKNLNERSYKIVSLYIEKIKEYIANEESAIDIWYVVVPHSVWLNCRPKSRSGKATISKNQIDIYQSGQTTLFMDVEEQVSEYADMYESDSDFHDQLKARALYEKIQTPIQIILEDTLLFKSKSSGEPFSDDMKAHLLWTHSSTIYYKLGYLPWKLAGVRDGVCYIGLVFKKLQDYSSQKGYACSAAQMFLDSGDGVIFRGNVGPWMSKNEKTYHLDQDAAHQLIKMAVDSYKQNKGYYPKELFIHGKAAFTDEEWEGFKLATKDADGTNLVGITIKSMDGFRVFNDTYSKKGEYGVLRGLAYLVNNKSGYLWTKGYIPSTETTNHMEIAQPLKISISRGESDINCVLKDILSLTKLNYNACIYGDGLPVTLRFSDCIGDILTAIKDVNWPAKPFKYYI